MQSKRWELDTKIMMLNIYVFDTLRSHNGVNKVQYNYNVITTKIIKNNL